MDTLLDILLTHRIICITPRFVKGSHHETFLLGRARASSLTLRTIATIETRS